MRVFLSWSGARSQAVAETLHRWLPILLHFVEPWFSHTDMQPGDRWHHVLSQQFDETDVGILCITRENFNAPWILFEAGALVRSVQKARVVPLLIDIDAKELSRSPLGQFHALSIGRETIYGLGCYLNNSRATPIAQGPLDRLFDLVWPRMEKDLESAINDTGDASSIHTHQDTAEGLNNLFRHVEFRLEEALNKINPATQLPMINELSHGLGPRDPLRFLLFASVFRDSAPWLYVLGIDAYRASYGNNVLLSTELQRRFLHMAYQVSRGLLADNDEFKRLSHTVIPELDAMLDGHAEATDNISRGKH